MGDAAIIGESDISALYYFNIILSFSRTVELDKINILPDAEQRPSLVNNDRDLTSETARTDVSIGITLRMEVIIGVGECTR